MGGKLAILLGMLLLVFFVSGCILEEEPVVQPDTTVKCQTPKKIIGEVCCYDENGNNVCDMDEAGCPESCDDLNACTNESCSGTTDFKCEYSTIFPCCGNDVCENNEDKNNICPEDCEVLDITDFQYAGTPDYMDDDIFVFIHTATAEYDFRLFKLNITAPANDKMENIRYTFKCNSSQHSDLDSIDSEPDNVSDEIELKINKLDSTNYLIYSNFFLERDPAYGMDIEELDEGERAQFHINIDKKEPQKRDELRCLFKFYFMEPRKMVHKVLKIDFI